MQDNLMQIVGNLGYDPETKHFDSGARLTTLNVAVYAGKDKPANWVKVKAWNEAADQVPQGLVKGNRIFVSGSCGGSEAWIGKVDGKAKSSVILNADVVALKPWVDRGGSSDSRASSPAKSSPSQPVDDGSRSIDEYDSISF